MKVLSEVKVGLKDMVENMSIFGFLGLMVLLGFGLCVVALILFGIFKLLAAFPVLLAILATATLLGFVGFLIIAYFIGRDERLKKEKQAREFAEADAREAARQAERTAQIAGRKPKRSSGFAIVELLIAVVIVGILAAILVPSGGGPFFFGMILLAAFGSTFFWSRRMNDFGRRVVEKIMPRWEEVGQPQWRIVKEFPAVQMREVRQEQQEINLKNGKTRWVPVTESHSSRQRRRLEAMPKEAS